MLDVRRMRVLREVALRGSFSAAAESLSFTQSAVSQQIAALEREAGAVLVERSARGVRLTDAGEAVVRHAEGILARLAEAEAELEAIAGLRGGRLRMATFESAAGRSCRSPSPFAGRHPAVELSMSLMEPEDSLVALRAGDVDIAMSLGRARRHRGRGRDPPPPARGSDVPRAPPATTRWRTSAGSGSPTWPTSRGSAASPTASAPG